MMGRAHYNIKNSYEIHKHITIKPTLCRDKVERERLKAELSIPTQLT